MKNKTSKISILLLFFAFMGGSFFASPVFADENSLIVEFEDTPLFSEANFLPGNSITRFIKVTNNTTEAQPIAIESINVTDPDSLGDVLNIKIVEGVTELYNDTLSNFFGAGDIFLSNLAGGEIQTQYDITVGFQSSAENPFQEKSLGFDVLIGFQGQEEVGPSSSGGGGGGGGGGSSLLSGLVIQSESVKTTDIAETSVTIVWTTSFFSTSQVIFAADGEPRGLDLSAPNFGYPHAFPDPEDTTKVTGHSVTITGLTPGVTYFFRAVSHASPATISREGIFTTIVLAENIESGEFGEIERTEDLQKDFISEAGLREDSQKGDISDTIKTIEEPVDETESIPSESDSDETEENKQLAAALGIGNTGIFGVVIVVALVAAIYILSRKRRKKSSSQVNGPNSAG